DLGSLEKQGLLPKEWASIKEVRFQPTSEVSRAWIEANKPVFKTNPQGEYLLEVVVLDWTDEEEGGSGAILQMSLIRLSDNEKIYELGRTYTLNDTKAEAVSAPASAKQ